MYVCMMYVYIYVCIAILLKWNWLHKILIKYIREQLKSHEQFLKEEEKANLEKLDEVTYQIK